METKTDNIAAQLNKFIKLEDAPAFGGGTLSPEDDKFYSGLAHLFSIIIWPWKRKASPAVDAHGKEALNMAITFFLVVNIPLMIIARILPVSILWLFSIIMTLVSLAMLAIFIYGLIQARQGKLLRYPFNLRLIK